MVVPIDDSLAEAVALAWAGDETAFARIIQAHHDNMTRVCFVVCGDLDIADEAVQAAWPIGGLIGTGVAGPAVAVLTILMWFIDIIAPALRLPDAVHQLALTAHYGQPMLGVWDPVGIGASLVLAFGGVLVGGWGLARRDLRI